MVKKYKTKDITYPVLIGKKISWPSIAKAKLFATIFARSSKDPMRNDVHRGSIKENEERWLDRPTTSSRYLEAQVKDKILLDQ